MLECRHVFVVFNFLKNPTPTPPQRRGARVGWNMQDQQFTVAVQKLQTATSVAVITGAGISAESGIPTFRGTDGLWKEF